MSTAPRPLQRGDLHPFSGQDVPALLAWRAQSRPGHPFSLFLDDLQWIDAASLQLLEQWVSDAASHHLLVIGAYRDKEVGPSHPLALSLSRLRDAGCDIHTIQLKELGASAIAQLAAGEAVALREAQPLLSGSVNEHAR